jgi:hypothetical protein
MPLLVAVVHCCCVTAAVMTCHRSWEVRTVWCYWSLLSAHMGAAAGGGGWGVGCNKWTLTVLIGNDQQCRCPLETPVHKTMLHSSKHLPEVGEGVCAMAAFSSTPPLCGGSLQALDCQHLSILLTVSFVAYYRQSAYRTCRCISKLHPSHSRNTHS